MPKRRAEYRLIRAVQPQASWSSVRYRSPRYSPMPSTWSPVCSKADTASRIRGIEQRRPLWRTRRVPPRATSTDPPNRFSTPIKNAAALALRVQTPSSLTWVPAGLTGKTSVRATARPPFAAARWRALIRHRGQYLRRGVMSIPHVAQVLGKSLFGAIPRESAQPLAANATR
jgi:hypothetical protein